MAVVGVLTGQIYRSDLAGFNTYRLPPAVVRLSERFFAPLVGSLRPPRRTNRALPDDTRIHGAQRSADSNDEAITTARPPRPNSATARTRATAATEIPSPSVMRELVDEFTGRTERANAGLRVPTETEISHLTSMFPSMEREVVVGALQRR